MNTTTTTHPVRPEEIMALLDGELSVEHGKGVSSHVESCSDCAEIAASFVRGSQLLSSWTVPAGFASSNFENRVTEAFRGGYTRLPFAPAMRLSGFFRRHWIFAAASSATVAALAVLMTFAPRMTYLAQRKQRSMPVDLTRTNSRSEPINGRFVTDQQGRVGTVGKLETLVTPGAVADSNGLFHGVGDHVQDSFSVNSQPITDQQAKAFGGPLIARTVALSIITKQFDSARASINTILARHNGYSASVTVSTPQGAARALEASLRIPVPELSSALSELRVLGYVENETQGGEEVTQQHADLVARLKISRETERRFLAILRERSGGINEVLSTEQSIARVRGEIEQMEAEQKNLEHRVDFATVDLRVSEEYKAQLDSPSPSISIRFHNAFVAGYRGAAETIVGILLFFAEYGPALLTWLLILVPIPWLLWRRWRRNMVTASSVL
jgi:Domain of unknown function (DUF4349)